MWQELHGKLNSITSTAPKSTFDSSNRPLKLPWSTSRLKRMLRNKDKAWDTFDLNSTKENLDYAICIKARGGVNVIFSVFTYATELLKTNK